jgi:threonine synthase
MRGEKNIEPVLKPETIATAIRIGQPVNARKAIQAIYNSKGTAVQVSDEDITQAQRDLAKEGVGVEPASAASIAGLKKLAELGIEKDEVVVCITTGHLLKDPEAVMRVCGKPIEVEARLNAIMEALGS